MDQLYTAWHVKCEATYLEHLPQFAYCRVVDVSKAFQTPNWLLLRITEFIDIIARVLL